MKTLRARQALTRPTESGFTLIEVLVAMMIFAILATCVGYSLTLSLVMTRESQAREIAANLVAQQIDVNRSTLNVFNVHSGTSTQTVDGTVYTVTQTAGWVTSTGSAATCGSDEGLLQNKTVDVSVSWAGMRRGTKPVEASTLLSPSGPINDPSSGTILVHVTGATGSGVPNIPVSAIADTSVSGNTAVTVSPAPAATDSDGCSFILKVVPGTYIVKIGQTGDLKISNQQKQTPTASVPISAGDSAIEEFQYDTQATPKLTFAASAPASVVFPTNFTATFAPSGDAYSTPVTLTGKTGTTPLWPNSSGYDVFAGTFVALPAATPTSSAPICLSVDPKQWVTANSGGKTGVRKPGPVNTTASSSNPVSVPMPVVTAKNIQNKYLVAISATAAASVGDPGCATGMNYTFGKQTTPTTVLALPYGTWELHALTNSTDALTAANAVLVTNLTLPAGSPAATSTTIFTLDPR